MATPNELLFDSAISHQIGVRNFASGEVRRLLAILEEADRNLVRRLRVELARFGDDVDFTGEKLLALIAFVRGLRRGVMQQFRIEIRSMLFNLASAEAAFERRMLQRATPQPFDFRTARAKDLRRVTVAQPFDGRLLREWFQSLERADLASVTRVIQSGLAERKPVTQIIRDVAGTKIQRFSDGVLSQTRRNAEAVIRTSITHVSTAARQEVWKENADSIIALRWTAILDGRTSAICRARDEHYAPVPGGKPLPPDLPRLRPEGARPPAHVNCRSVMVPILDPEKFGAIPDRVSYNEWLRRQTAEEQDKILGKAKGALFRRGDLDVDKFVDRRGQEITLDQLRKQEPKAFAD